MRSRWSVLPSGTVRPWKTFHVRTTRAKAPITLGPVRRRGRFADLIERQLDLFAEEHGELVEDAEAALRAYDAADRDEAEERYGEFVDVADTGREHLGDLRETFAATLDDDIAEEYRAAFDRRARKRFPTFGAEPD
jgi:hypothetical protein